MRMLKSETTNAEVTVKSDVIRRLQNYSDAKTSYEASRLSYEPAEMTYKMEKERYDLGISNIGTITTMNQAYIKAQGDFQNAKYSLMFQGFSSIMRWEH